MRRWLVFALIPSVLVVGHIASVIAVEAIKGSTDDLVAMGVFLLELYGITALGYWLARRWPLPQHAVWSLPLGIAIGFLPWAIAQVRFGGSTPRFGGALPFLAVWAATAALLGLAVRALLARSRWGAATVARMGGLLLFLVLPFLTVRAQIGAEAPWSSILEWAPRSTIHPEGFGSALWHQTAARDAAPLAMMVVLGTTLYFGALFGTNDAVRRTPVPSPPEAKALVP